MHCVKKIQDDLYWVGASERRLNLFENAYPLTNGVSYNSYLILDEKVAVMDSVDARAADEWLAKLAHELDGRSPDYLVISHMEPDHSATLSELLLRHPETTVVCNDKTAVMIAQFFGKDAVKNMHLVKEGDVLSAGAHELTFYLAPMIHWPEVMMTYDKSAHTLFTADAFGVFGALNGAIFADEVDFDRDYLKEARRYYTNIVGKYGVQVQNLFKKIAGLDISMLCPLHGFVWRENLGYILEKYNLWSTYIPEDKGVMIAYASIYGNTENAAALKIKGGIIYVGEKAVAFTLGSAVNAEVFDIHIEKSLAEYAEGYTVINREFAANELANYKYINREDDMGLDGLRQAKLSYHPAVMVKKYSAVKKVTE